jgi:hypothetical protein
MSLLLEQLLDTSLSVLIQAPNLEPPEVRQAAEHTSDERSHDESEVEIASMPERFVTCTFSG